MSPEQLRAEPRHLLYELEPDWTGHEGSSRGSMPPNRT